MNGLGVGIGIAGVAWAIAWCIVQVNRVPDPSVECVRAGGYWYVLANRRDGNYSPHCEAKVQP